MLRPGPGGGRLPAAGGGADFLEHACYRPGDELRQLDWRATARRGRPVVRRMQEDAACRVEVWVDASGSMAYPEPPACKLAVARDLAAAVVRAALAAGCTVGLAAVGSAGAARPPLAARGGQRQWARAVAFLGSLTAAGSARWGEHLPRLAQRLGPPAWIWLVGDWTDPADEPLASALAGVSAAGHRLSILEVRHRREEELDFAGPVALADMEGDGERSLDPLDRAAAARAVARQRGNLATVLGRAGVWAHSVVVDEDAPARQLAALRQAMRPGQAGSAG